VVSKILKRDSKPEILKTSFTGPRRPANSIFPFFAFNVLAIARMLLRPALLMYSREVKIQKQDHFTFLNQIGKSLFKIR